MKNDDSRSRHGAIPPGDWSLWTMPLEHLEAEIEKAELESEVEATRWHYLPWTRLHEVMKSKVLLPAPLDPLGAGPPAVWFSIQHTWDPAAQLAEWPLDEVAQVNLDEIRLYGGGLGRIAVEPATAPSSWEDYRRLAPLSLEAVLSLELAAQSIGLDPRQWFASLLPVPKEKWIAVEVWQDDSWKKVRHAL